MNIFSIIQNNSLQVRCSDFDKNQLQEEKKEHGLRSLVVETENCFFIREIVWMKTAKYLKTEKYFSFER